MANIKAKGNRFKLVLDNLHDGIYQLSKDHKILYWNKSAELISGYRADEVLGRECSKNILMHMDAKGNRLCNGMCPMKSTLLDGKVREADVYLHHKDGHRVPVIVRAAPVYDDEGNIESAVEIFFDPSSAKALEKEIESLKKLALLDSLTQVGNRRYGEDKLQGLFQEVKRYNRPFGVLFCDIDYFKKFNDEYGHSTGDRVLRMVAQTLKNGLRTYDTLCRWGGEEFLAIVRDVDEASLAGIAEKLRRLVEGSELPDACNCLAVTISIGGTMAQPDDEPSDIVKRADEKMYECKARGRNCVSV